MSTWKSCSQVHLPLPPSLSPTVKYLSSFAFVQKHFKVGRG